ncbi:S-formylglutathione hydrolase FrmB [Nocardiopsis sp. Huas11]|uniref:alpha/beta hydrolase n=1 Tax=Nocardiopsis sp. Huas11 TaxID=2183912 RepID=UPI000EAB99A7|nr:alpha/beta hydrolase-fold protein [Nocardiopsis sp. Huas11]RKS06058.1 S-formylglutathione hydrolase FrmB [Nocardiopsis sp. Huas11]
MFATFSRRAVILVSSCVVAVAAAALATLPPEGVADRLGLHPPEADPALATGRLLVPGDREAPVPAPIPQPGQVAVCNEPGTDEVVTLADESAPGSGRPVWIRRPPGPDSADLPVLYLLHGSASTHETLMAQDLGPLLDHEMCRTGVEFVIAAPHGQENRGATTEWADAADGRFALESFVTGPVIEAVEGEHVRPRELRAIGGFSMGGYGAAAAALRHPDLYAQVASWAGYFRVDDPDGVLGEGAADHSPDLLLDSADVEHLRFVLVEGTEEHTPLREGSIRGEAERFADLLADRGMTVATLQPRGGHDFPTWGRALPDVADFLVSGWAATP